MKEQAEAKISQIAHEIAQSRRVVVFTGAGVSTESGIPDFRSAGGIWSRFDPEDFTIDRFLSSPQVRRKHWQLLLEESFFDKVEPNEAHLAIAALEKMDRLSAVITQNIDGLHQKAGNSPGIVFELHGNMQTLSCRSCGAGYYLPRVRADYLNTGKEPICEQCRGLLKPDVVFFGENLPPQVLQQAIEHARHADIFLVIGSSLLVYPAAYLPLWAKEGGAKLFIVNRDETSHDDLADILVRKTAGPLMKAVIAEVARLIRH